MIVQKNKPKVTVILPAYNEGLNICDGIQQVYHTLSHFDLELIVVDDGSTDNTRIEILRATKMGYPTYLISNKDNLGKGGAILRGFEQSQGDFVAFLDADLEIAPIYVTRLYEILVQNQLDGVIGSKEGQPSHFPISRKFMSWMFRKLVSFLFGLTLRDTQTGIKLFKRKVLEQVVPRIQTYRFVFDLELLVISSRFGFNIQEIPVNIKYVRQGHLGRVRVSHMIGMLSDLFEIYYRASFWRWLEPGLSARIWMLSFVAGVFLFGIGVGKLLTPMTFYSPIKEVFFVVAMQFLPLVIRDWLLAIVGCSILLISAVELNKILLNAFMQQDNGELEGIFHKRD